jgi:hypothetical protein
MSPNCGASLDRHDLPHFRAHATRLSSTNAATGLQWQCCYTVHEFSQLVDMLQYGLRWMASVLDLPLEVLIVFRIMSQNQPQQSQTF